MELEDGLRYIQSWNTHASTVKKWIAAIGERPDAQLKLVELYRLFNGFPEIDTTDPSLRLDWDPEHIVLRDDTLAYVVATSSLAIYGIDRDLWPVDDRTLWPWGYFGDWGRLSPDLLAYLSLFLHPVDLIRCAGVCSSWRAVFNDTRVWKWFFVKIHSLGGGATFLPGRDNDPVPHIVRHLPPPRRHVVNDTMLYALVFIVALQIIPVQFFRSRLPKNHYVTYDAGRKWGLDFSRGTVRVDVSAPPHPTFRLCFTSRRIWIQEPQIVFANPGTDGAYWDAYITIMRGHSPARRVHLFDHHKDWATWMRDIFHDDSWLPAADQSDAVNSA